MMRRRFVGSAWFWSVMLGTPLLLATTGTWAYVALRRALQARGDDLSLAFASGGYGLLLVWAFTTTYFVCRKLHQTDAQLTHTESTAEQRESIMRTVFDNIAEGVIVANEQGRLVLFNPAARQFASPDGVFDKPPEQWASHYGVFLPDRETLVPTAQLPMVRAMRGEAVDADLVFLRNPTAPEGRFLSISARPLYAGGGTYAGAVVVFRDVTEARESEEAIRRLNHSLGTTVAELSAVNEELETFAYSVSHDLRAPLRHVLGFVDLLQARLGEAGVLDETSARHLTIVGDAARQMTTLIDDLLAFSRTGRADMHETTVELAALVRDVQVEVSRDAAGREIDWQVGRLPTVRGDKAMLRIVFVNLLSNAVKYTRPRGLARIEVTGQSGHPHHCDQVVIAIRDNGVGFDMQYADKLFGVFQRLHRAEEFEGTGIGLATVRRIVHRHGGHTWAEAALEEGAVFYVSLPLARVVQPATA